MNRRTWLSLTTASLAATTASLKALAKEFPGDMAPRGVIGKLERLPWRDLESNEDFLTSYRTWVQGEIWRAADRRAVEMFKSQGIDPQAEVPMADAVKLLEADPVIAMSAHAWLRGQELMWRNMVEEFHGNADQYLTEMAAADKTGPGTLELKPKMFIPDYAKHEIHMQPGGYVGDEFAGHIYYYGTHNFYTGANYQDETHAGFASRVATPADGKIKRILELGCGTGQMAIALKERFPDAEVWALDVGGPMVRFAHMHAVDCGANVNFVQGLAEDTQFPDGHFDIVTSYILHHEIPAEISRRVFREAHRLVRPGGIYFPIDTYARRPIGRRTARGLFSLWWIHRWNQEVWTIEYSNLDSAAAMRDAGFDVNEQGPGAWPGYKYNLLGAKKA